MQKLVIVISVLLLASTMVFAQERWESATNVDQEPTGDIMLTRCIYETNGGYRFSIVARDICPFEVQVNPETGRVRVPR